MHQPFEPELDWRKFSVTVPQSDIPRLHEILAEVTNEQHAAMQVRMRVLHVRHLGSTQLLGLKG